MTPEREREIREVTEWEAGEDAYLMMQDLLEEIDRLREALLEERERE